MTTTANNEAWAVAFSRYENLLKIDLDLLEQSGSEDMGEDWEAAHREAFGALDLLIDTPALTFIDTLAKLRAIIRHAHLEGPSDDLDDAEVRTEALSDPTRDGPWPLLRVLEDLERLAESGSPELAAAALSVADFEEQEQAALNDAHRLATSGERDRNVVNARLSALDRRLHEAVQVAAAVTSRGMADHRHKAQILKAVLSSGMFSAQGFSDAELALMKSLCSDLIESTT